MTLYNRFAELKRLYAAQTEENGDESAEQQTSSLAYLRERLYAPRLINDLDSLDAHSSYTAPAGYSLVQRVFGQQIEQAKVRVSHLGHLLRERSEIYETHMADVNEQVSDLKNLLAMARRPYGFHTLQQIASLERVVQSAEAEERRERLAFWKDTAEIRDRLLEAAIEYKATSGRANLLSPSEEADE